MNIEQKVIEQIKESFTDTVKQKVALEVNERLRNYYAYLSLKERWLDLFLGDFFDKFSAGYLQSGRFNEIEKRYPHPNIFLHVRSIRYLNGVGRNGFDLQSLFCKK